MTAFEERPHSPYYGSVDATPLYVVLLDEYERWTGDTSARARARDRGAGRAQLDRRVRRPPGQRLHLRTSAATRRPASRTSAGRTRGTRSPTATAACPASRARPASCRATPTTRRCAARAWRASSGRTRRSPTGSRRRPPTSSAASTATSGSRTASTSPSRSTPTAARSTRSPRTTATCSGAASSTSRRRRRSPGTCIGAGYVLRLGRAHAGRGRGALQPDRLPRRARSGRSTTRSSPGACGATASRRRRRAIAAGILDAAEFFDGRLPEAFGGYQRALTKYPVQYPTACSPQAWSTGAPLLLLRTMLGLEPLGDHLVVDPALPSGIGHLELLDIPGRWGRIDAFGRGRVDVEKRPRRARSSA